jgi:hypothetical protein
MYNFSDKRNKKWNRTILHKRNEKVLFILEIIWNESSENGNYKQLQL